MRAWETAARLCWAAAFAAALAACGGTTRRSGGADQAKPVIESRLGELTQGLRDKRWDGVSGHFADDAYGGTDAIRTRLEEVWRSSNLLDMQFIIDNVMRKEDLYNVKLRWNKTALDAAGQPKKTSGSSEVLMRKRGSRFQIIDIKGDQFF